MSFHQKEGLRYFQFDSFSDLPVFHAVLTRHGGVSKSPFDSLNTGGTVGDDREAVLQNHELIYAAFGYNFDSRFDVWQVHGTDVICSDSPREVGAPHQKGDVILTDNPDLTLFMRFADCVPILLVDPVKYVIGIIHAGWQGTYKQIARIAIEKMTSRYGSNPGSIFAGIGPSICQACYEVGDEVHQAFVESLGTGADRFFLRRDGKLLLDLWQSNRELLLEAGLRSIETSGICTACNLDDWYSHRAEHGRTGRFGVLLSLNKQKSGGKA